MPTARSTTNGFFVVEALLFLLRIERRGGRATRTTERQHAINEAFVAAHDALRFVIDLIANVVVSG